MGFGYSNSRKGFEKERKKDTGHKEGGTRAAREKDNARTKHVTPTSLLLEVVPRSRPFDAHPILSFFFPIHSFSTPLSSLLPSIFFIPTTTIPPAMISSVRSKPALLARPLVALTSRTTLLHSTPVAQVSRRQLSINASAASAVASQRLR